MSDNGWLRLIEENPGHSAWYIERFRTMAADGADLDGEARFVDAMVPRGARILDAGCGPGRLGGRLHDLGHTVWGVDIDAALVAAAAEDHPGPFWLVGDLADLAVLGDETDFDAIVSAGNVMTFLDPATRVEVLRQLCGRLAPEGRLVVGFGANRGYDFSEFDADARTAGLRDSVRFSTWDMRPFTPDSDFVVAVLERAD